MSYQVLARKYRPRTFHELVGQEHVSKALIHALDQDRLHHAYLFTGTRGVGKTTIARILSRCLNCEQGVSSQPCGTCDACVEISEGRFVDLIEVDAASRTKVEDTRELLDNVQYAPTRGRYKVYLIDEVHMLSAHSFNALLKTLEEPPPHVKFLLATTDPQKLPVTILSRCLQFNLKALSAERIASHLQALLDKEMIRYEAPALQLLGQAARGSMRDALSLTDQAIAFGGEQLSESAVRSMLGTVDREHVLKLLQALAGGDAATVLDALDDVAEQSPDELSLLDEMISSLHAIAIAQALPTRQPDESLKALASQFRAEQVQLYYDIALRGRRDLGDAPDARMGLEMLLLRMVLFRPDGVLPAGGAGAVKKSDRPAPAPVATPAASSAQSASAMAGHASQPAAAEPARAGLRDVQQGVQQQDAPREALKEAAREVPKEVPREISRGVTDSPAPVVSAPQRPSPTSLTPVAAAPARSAPLPPPANADSDPGQWWASVVAALPIDGMVRNLAMHAVLASRDGDRWTLNMDPGHQVLATPERINTLQQALSTAMTQRVSVEVVAVAGTTGTPAERAEAARLKKLQQTRDSISRDPVVQTLVREFDARLDIESIEPD